MLSNNRVIIKLGGSVISNKAVPHSFNEEIVAAIADELISFHPSHEIILVHGGGSFGHPVAKRYGIKEGIKGMESRIGFARTHEAMLELNYKIVDIFFKKNLPVFPVVPSSLFIVEQGNIIHGDTYIINMLLKNRFIPILFGDVALSADKGIDILSGDQIISYLARMFMPEKVIFLMDVDGIYDREPDACPEARLLRLIDNSVSISGATRSFDVTGGIHNKIEQAQKLNCTVFFINGTVPGNLTKVLNGIHVGTMMK